jgi:hypothetical protein
VVNRDCPDVILSEAKNLKERSFGRLRRPQDDRGIVGTVPQVGVYVRSGLSLFSEAGTVPVTTRPADEGQVKTCPTARLATGTVVPISVPAQLIRSPAA